MELIHSIPEPVVKSLSLQSRLWLVTGVAGFIGSNILEVLLASGQRVRGLDNFATGHQANLERVRAIVGELAWAKFEFIEGDIRDYDIVRSVINGAEIVLHQAALGSVPRSIADPRTTDAVNVGGFLNVLSCAQQAGTKRFVYAGSSSTYGDHPALPKVEENIGSPLSPYAVTKLINEQYAAVFAKTYSYRAIGLRYFNVFGPRQDPDGAYAAVIPKWAAAMSRNDPIVINGDGETSRDFCYVSNVVQANILAGIAGMEAEGQVYNVAVGGSTSLNTLFVSMRREMAGLGLLYEKEPVYAELRKGDVRHSQADIRKAQRLLGYDPTETFDSGLNKAMPYYLSLRQ